MYGIYVKIPSVMIVSPPENKSLYGLKLDWSSPKQLNTRRGIRYLIKAHIPSEIPEKEEFWALWKGNGEDYKNKGYTVFKEDNRFWVIQRWCSSIKEAEETIRIQADAKKMSVEQAKREAEDKKKREEILRKAEEERDRRRREWVPYIQINESGLLSYQIPHVKKLTYAIRQFNAAIDCSDTGTGKTFSALAVARELGLRPLVVTPKATIPSWRRAALQMKVYCHDVLNYEKIKTGKTKHMQWTCPNKGKEKPQWQVPSDVFLIFDEIQRAKSNSSQNSKLVIAAKEQKIITLGLSATAATSPLEMRALGYMLDLHKLSDFFFFCKNNGCRKIGGALVYNAAEHGMLNIHRKIFPDRGSRMRIADLGKLFPETQVLAEAYDCDEQTDKIRDVYNEMFEELAELEAKEDMDAAQRRANILVIMLRARQKAELLKIPTMSSLVKDAIDEGMSVAVFLNFTDSIIALADRVKTDCLIIGGQNAADRQKNIDRFQKDESHIILCNIKAGGVGISLHDINGHRRRLALISPTFSGMDLKQALGRVHRAGGKSASIQKIFFAANTIEEDICEKVRKKLELIDHLNDGELDKMLSF